MIRHSEWIVSLDEDKGTVAIDVIQEAPEMESFEATGAFDKSMFYKESNDDEVVVLLSGDTHTSELPNPSVQQTPPSVEVEVVQKVPEVDPERNRYAEERQAKEAVPVNDGKKWFKEPSLPLSYCSSLHYWRFGVYGP